MGRPNQNERCTVADLDYPPRTSRTGFALVIAVIIGAILLLLSWLFRFPWDYLGHP